MTDRPLRDQRIVLIGGSSGIGLATAEAAARQGARVVLAGRNAERLAAARKAVGEAETHALDATDEAALAAFFDALGAIDHVANFVTAAPNAEVRQAMGTFMATPQWAMEAILRNKFWSQVFTARHARPQMREGGSIVFVTGQAHRKHLPTYSAIAAADSAVETLARVLAVELAPVRVNVVAPGLIATPLLRTLPPAVQATFDARTAPQPVPRMGRPEEIAGAILWVMANAYVTGTVLEVDGGFKLT